jgi:mRNA interferase YafQ
MYKIASTRRYIDDLRRAKRRNLPFQELENVVRALAEGRTLAPKHKDHALKGEWNGYRECHIRPDWLLIYKIEHQILTLVLTRTGTHADLF